jgi:hypothetical protein
MVIVALWGGLGNQMFQYAAARALSQRLRTDLAFDFTYFSEMASASTRQQGGVPRRFELDRLCIRGRAATGREVERLAGKVDEPSHLDRVKFRLRRIIAGDRRYRAPERGFDPNFHNLSGDVYLSGRFHHPRYFHEIKAELEEELRPNLLSPAAGMLIKEVTLNDSIGVHVRRGDYVSDPAYSSIGAQPSEYYHNAYQLIASASQKNPTAYIFSDDIEWCRTNLRFPTTTHFVSDQSTILAYEEQEVMKHCSHIIVSNSTFSWWAAWLKKGERGIIVAPKIWYQEPRVTGEEYCPPDWRTV